MLSVRLLTCLPQPSFAPSRRLAAPLAVLWCLALPGAHAQAPTPSPLPPEVEAALSRARLPREALSVLVVDAQGGAAPRLPTAPRCP